MDCSPSSKKVTINLKPSNQYFNNQYKMKNYIWITLLVVSVAACGPADQKARLEKLLADRQNLDRQIENLRAELGESDTLATDRPVNVLVTTLQPTEFKSYIEVQGKVDADENTEATPQSPGMVEAVYVKEGDAVKRGQLLAELDTRVLRQSLEEVKTQLDFATNLYQKQKSLWEKNIGSEIQYLSAKNNMESLQKRYATLEDQVNLSKIKSPINGTVESVPFKVGQLISPGMPGSSIRVINMANAKIVAELAESYAPRLKNGNEVVVVLPDINKELSSRLTFASRYIDPVNRTFRVETRLHATDVEFRANMIAMLRINDYIAKEAIVLPLHVIQKSQAGDYVIIATEKQGRMVAERRMVTVARVSHGLAEISAGLKAGDSVVTTGFQSVKDGQTLVFNR